MPSFLQHLTALAEETGEYVGLTTTSLGTTTTLLSSTLVNSNLEATELEDVAALVESGNNAGEQRFVRRAGLARGTGTITTADAYTNAVASGVSFSLYHRMPALTRLSGPSYQKAINQAHRRAWVEDNVSFTGVTGQKHYPIDTAVWPWFTEKSRVIAVYRPRQNADDELQMLGSDEWDWAWDGSVRQLVLPSSPWNTGDTGIVKVYRPANSIIRRDATGQAVLSTTTVGSVTVLTGGYYTVAPTVTFSGGGGANAAGTAVLTGNAVTSVTITNAGTGYTTAPTVSFSAGGWKDETSQSAGLTALSDESLMDVNDLVVLGSYFVYKMLADMHHSGQETGEWIVKRRLAAEIAANLKCLQPRPNRLTGIPNLRATYSGSRGHL